MLDTSTPTKRCGKCGEEKPALAEYFHRDKKRKDGLHSRCKVCVQKYSRENSEKLVASTREWQLNNPDKYQEYQRNYNRSRYIPYSMLSPEEKAKRYQYVKEFHRRNPDKKRQLDAKYRLKYREKNREKNRERCRDRRTRIKAEKLRRVLRRSGALNPSFEYFHGYCAVCAVELSRDAKPVIWTQSKPDMLVLLCNRCIADKGNREPKDWLTHRCNAPRVAEILRIMKDYSIWLEEVKNHAN